MSAAYPPSESPTTENTPLIPSATNAQPQPRTNAGTDTHSHIRRDRLFNQQTLSGLSVLLCLALGLTCWILTIPFYANRRYWAPYYIADAFFGASQLAFYTSLPSLLNYARMRRSDRELPWLFNIPFDFIIVVSTFLTGVWYLIFNVSVWTDEKSRCGRDLRHVRECEAYMDFGMAVGFVVVVLLLQIAATHGCLFWMRVFKTQVPVERSTGVGVWREGGGWFVGFGRGPLAVRNVSGNGQEERREEV